jgi:kynurenine formamidase
MSSELLSSLPAAQVYDLEQPRFFEMPVYPSHKPGYFYALHRRHRDGTATRRTSASGMLTMMEHAGTHIDAYCHQAFDGKLYGGIPVKEVETPAGFTKLGVEQMPPIVARGVLLDVAGAERLPEEYSIPAQELEACAARQGVEIQKGDVLLVRTGFGAVWDNEALYLQAAGVSKSGTLWAAEREVLAVGADNMAWDVPGERDPETGATLFAHACLLAQKGIYIIENLNLEQLAAERRYTFAFIATPLKLRGATGSPIRPIALV